MKLTVSSSLHLYIGKVIQEDKRHRTIQLSKIKGVNVSNWENIRWQQQSIGLSDLEIKVESR